MEVQTGIDGAVKGFPDITDSRYSDELKDWIHDLRIDYRTISNTLEEELEARKAVEKPWVLSGHRLLDLKRLLDSGNIERWTGENAADRELLLEDANELDALGAISIRYPGDKVKPVELGRIILESDPEAQIGAKDFELWYDVEPSTYVWAEENLETGELETYVTGEVFAGSYRSPGSALSQDFDKTYKLLEGAVEKTDLELREPNGHEIVENARRRW